MEIFGLGNQELHVQMSAIWVAIQMHSRLAEQEAPTESRDNIDSLWTRLVLGNNCAFRWLRLRLCVVVRVEKNLMTLLPSTSLLSPDVLALLHLRYRKAQYPSKKSVSHRKILSNKLATVFLFHYFSMCQSLLYISYKEVEYCSSESHVHRKT